MEKYIPIKLSSSRKLHKSLHRLSYTLFVWSNKVQTCNSTVADENIFMKHATYLTKHNFCGSLEVRIQFSICSSQTHITYRCVLRDTPMILYCHTIAIAIHRQKMNGSIFTAIVSSLNGKVWLCLDNWK